jgi:hypothetical protein
MKSRKPLARKSTTRKSTARRSSRRDSLATVASITFNDLDVDSERYAGSPSFPEARTAAIAQAYRDGYRTALADLIERDVLDLNATKISPAFRRRS